MNLNYLHLVPDNFAMNSRVWIYQSNRAFSAAETLQVNDLLHQFVKNWQSHGVPVKGYASLFFDRFIVFLADETATGVSGCSTDSSVRLIKELEHIFSVSLFDRQSLAFLIENEISVLPLSVIQSSADNELISGETIYFNNLVQTKKEFINHWLIPVRESWLGKRLVLKPLA
jgi:hypothetical protein